MKKTALGGFFGTSIIYFYFICLNLTTNLFLDVFFIHTVDNQRADGFQGNQVIWMGRDFQQSCQTVHTVTEFITLN